MTKGNGRALDLTGLDAKRWAEEGYIVNIIDPTTRKPSGFRITVLGADSQAHRAKQDELGRRQAERARLAAERGEPLQPFTPEEIEQVSAELLAAVTQRWEPECIRLDDSGNRQLPEAERAVHEFTVADAQRFYARMDVIREQLFKAAHDRANFLPGSVRSS